MLHGPAEGRRGDVARLFRALPGLATIKTTVIMWAHRGLGHAGPHASGSVLLFTLRDPEFNSLINWSLLSGGSGTGAKGILDRCHLTPFRFSVSVTKCFPSTRSTALLLFGGAGNAFAPDCIFVWWCEAPALPQQ